MENTRTGTVSSGILETYVSMRALFGSSLVGKGTFFKNVTLRNTGGGNLRVVSLANNYTSSAVDGDSVLLEPGDSISLQKVNIEYCFIRTEDDGQTNSFDFIGDVTD